MRRVQILAFARMEKEIVIGEGIGLKLRDEMPNAHRALLNDFQRVSN